ncbi:MAG TPA: NADH-quinone oxidoreductase subunit C [Terriglobales bacterium]|nr:NADH-quinone oxidoreductase subunit C [Terriglobales bacterium]
MALPPAITDFEQLRGEAPVARLLGWRSDAVAGAKLDRGELSIEVRAPALREAGLLLRDDADLRFNFLSDLTCVDWHPREPRFEVVYHLLSIPRRARVRLKVRLAEGDAGVESVTSVWPSANFFEREVFDLFGVRFLGHPDLRRIMMPEDWQGHPLRKDYPVEGYR